MIRARRHRFGTMFDTGHPWNARNTWAAVAIGGGAALGAGAGLMQGQATNRAGRQQRDFTGARLGEGYQRATNAYYGQGNPADWSVPGGHVPTPTSDSILGRMGTLSQWGQQQGQNIQSGYNADTQRLMGMAQGAEGMARNWGVGRAGVINSDYDLQLKNANQAGDAALAAGGFNSPTIQSQQYAGNQATIGREKQRALEDLSESQIDRQMGARTQTLNIGGARASGNTGLQQALLNQNIGLQNAPLQAEQNFTMSSVANPYLTVNTSGYFPGASGAGNAAGNLGGLATAYGGYQLGQQNQANMLNQFGANMPFYMGSQYGPPSPIH